MLINFFPSNVMTWNTLMNWIDLVTLCWTLPLNEKNYRIVHWNLIHRRENPEAQWRVEMFKANKRSFENECDTLTFRRDLYIPTAENVFLCKSSPLINLVVRASFFQRCDECWKFQQKFNTQQKRCNIRCKEFQEHCKTVEHVRVFRDISRIFATSADIFSTSFKIS